jgi:hypothetical protein
VAPQTIDAPAADTTPRTEGQQAMRKERSDKKDPADRFSARLAVKLTARGRKNLHRLAVAAGHKSSDSNFVRALLDKELARLKAERARGVNTIPENFSFTESDD